MVGFTWVRSEFSLPRVSRSLESTNGDVAQLVEHLLCKQGVGGSSPLVSTIRIRGS
jgi:hypothetical protein